MARACRANVGPALRRMQQAGVVPTTYKTFFYEMGVSVDRDAMPPQWRERRRAHRGKFKSPYDLLPSTSSK